MKNIYLTICLVLFLGSCTSFDEEQATESLSTLLTRNAWVYDRTEIEEITSHGSLSYAEAEQILLDFPLNSSNTTVSIYSFDNDGTGTIRYPNNTNIGTTNFGWIILPDNTLRFFLSSNPQNSNVVAFTVNENLLTLTNDQEYLYNGTLIKYKAKAYLNKQ